MIKSQQSSPHHSNTSTYMNNSSNYNSNRYDIRDMNETLSVIRELCSHIGIGRLETKSLLDECYKSSIDTGTQSTSLNAKKKSRKKISPSHDFQDRLVAFLKEYRNYAQLYDDLLSKLYSISQEFQSNWNDIVNDGTATACILNPNDLQLFVDDMYQLAYYTAKVFYIICSIRPLQQCPRVEISNSSNNIIEIVKHNTIYITNMLMSNYILLEYVMHNASLDVVAIISSFSFNRLVQPYKHTITGTQMDSSMYIAMSIDSIIQCEDKIASSWWSFKVMNNIADSYRDNGNIVADHDDSIYDFQYLLKIPLSDNNTSRSNNIINSSAPPVDTFSWYNNSSAYLTHYKNTKSFISYAMKHRLFKVVSTSDTSGDNNISKGSSPIAATTATATISTHDDCQHVYANSLPTQLSYDVTQSPTSSPIASSHMQSYPQSFNNNNTSSSSDNYSHYNDTLEIETRVSPTSPTRLKSPELSPIKSTNSTNNAISSSNNNSNSTVEVSHVKRASKVGSRKSNNSTPALPTSPITDSRRKLPASAAVPIDAAILPTKLKSKRSTAVSYTVSTTSPTAASIGHSTLVPKSASIPITTPIPTPTHPSQPHVNSIEVEASLHIQHWVRVSLPRRRFLKHQHRNHFIYTIIDNVIDNVIFTYQLKHHKKKWLKEMKYKHKQYIYNTAASKLQTWLRACIDKRRHRSNGLLHQNYHRLYKLKENEKLLLQEKLEKLTNINKLNNRIRSFQMRCKQYMNHKKCIKVAIFTQSRVRSYLVRCQLVTQMKAGLMIRRFFVRIMSVLNLREKLRRNNRSITITMGDMKYIPKHIAMSGECINYTISIWWAPLLHILNAADKRMFVKNHRPQQLIRSRKDVFSINQLDKDGSVVRRMSTLNLFSLGASLGIGGTSTAAVAGGGGGGGGGDGNRISNDVDATGKVLSPKNKWNSSSSSVMSTVNSGNTQPFCSFNDTRHTIPMCHGNTVFKFEFFFGDIIIGRHYYFTDEHMEDQTTLLFWGGSEEVNIEVAGSKGRATALTASNSNRGDVQHISSNRREKRNDIAIANNNNSVVFAFDITPGPPLRSNSSPCKLKIKETSGPIYRKLRGKSIFSALFREWYKVVLVADNYGIHFFADRKCYEPFITFPSDQIVKVACTAGERIGTVLFRSDKFSDNMDVTISLKMREDITFRFNDNRVRNRWIDVFTTIVSDNMKEAKRLEQMKKVGHRSSMNARSFKMLINTSIVDTNPLNTKLTVATNQQLSPLARHPSSALSGFNHRKM